MDFVKEIRVVAGKEQVDPALVAAIVAAESSGRTDAFRFEPAFWRRYCLNNPLYSQDTPRRVASSYGLMQVMYPTARERGFPGPPELLFIPEIGLTWGCRHLKLLLEWAQGDTWKAVAAYNGGQGNWDADTPQRYAAKVRSLHAAYSASHLFD